MAKWWRSLRTAIQYPRPPLSPLQPFHSQSSRYHTIQAIPREVAGRRVSAREREQGRIPAVVFPQSLLDKNPSNGLTSRKRLLTTEKKQIQAILKSVQLPFFCSTTFPLQVRAGSGSSMLLESGTVMPIKASHIPFFLTSFSILRIWGLCFLLIVCLVLCFFFFFLDCIIDI
jgi:large subunit ribosomal protein L25